MTISTATALFEFFVGIGSLLFRESKVADSAKHQVKDNHAASMSEDEPILIMATTSPPLSFPKQSMHFSKAKQDVWIS